MARVGRIRSQPVSGCACGTCYLGPWTHTVPPEGDPEPLAWADWCPYCADTPTRLGHREGLPFHWRLGRTSFLLASLFGALALWSHVILWGGR